MSVPLSLNGIRPGTHEHLLLDVGILWKNIDITQLRGSAPDPMASATAGAIRLGATRGGAKWSFGKQAHQIQLDGVRIPIKGLDRIDMWTPTLQVTLVEHTRDNVQNYLGASDVTYWDQYDEIVPRITIADTDYLTNIALFTTVIGSALPVVIVIDNPLAITSPDMPFVDKTEVGVQVDFRGAASEENPYLCPFHIFLPPSVASGSGS